jgi:hypothetical protein
MGFRYSNSVSLTLTAAAGWSATSAADPAAAYATLRAHM